MAVIDSESYLAMDDQGKNQTAEDFYNDTYRTDQNTCTSPRMVVWMGHKTEVAEEEFWGTSLQADKGKVYLPAYYGNQ